MVLYSEDEVRKMLSDKIGYAYKAGNMANDAGISRPAVSMALSGKQGLGVKLPKLVGMRRVIAYVKDDSGSVE